jgi:hypothetical protein
LTTADISRQIVVKNRRNEWAWESCKDESVEGVQVTKHERMCQKRTRWRRSVREEAMEEKRWRRAVDGLYAPSIAREALINLPREVKWAEPWSSQWSSLSTSTLVVTMQLRTQTSLVMPAFPAICKSPVPDAGGAPKFNSRRRTVAMSRAHTDFRGCCPTVDVTALRIARASHIMLRRSWLRRGLWTCIVSGPAMVWAL